MANALGLELRRMTCVAAMAKRGEVAKYRVKRLATVTKAALRASERRV
jgi:hypothetical protein